MRQTGGRFGRTGMGSSEKGGSMENRKKADELDRRWPGQKRTDRNSPHHASLHTFLRRFEKAWFEGIRCCAYALSSLLCPHCHGTHTPPLPHCPFYLPPSMCACSCSTALLHSLPPSLSLTCLPSLTFHAHTLLPPPFFPALPSPLIHLNL